MPKDEQLTNLFVPITQLIQPNWLIVACMDGAVNWLSGMNINVEPSRKIVLRIPHESGNQTTPSLTMDVMAKYNTVVG